jgi:alpha-amylase
VAIEGLIFADFPHLCHRNPMVYTAMMEYAGTLVEQIGFDGFRFDFVKGYGPWLIGTIAKYRYQRDGKDITPFVVGEYWEDNASIEQWLNTVNSFSDNQITAFDFPLRYRLKDLCDTPEYSLLNLAKTEGVIVHNRPAHAVTFVDNHDMEGGNAVANDKILGYSYILTHEGYPCVFWKDYDKFQLARPGSPNGIDALVDAHNKYAGGDSDVLYVDENLYIMQRGGNHDESGDQPGLIYSLNNMGDRWTGHVVKPQWKNQRLVPVAWNGHDTAHPEERTTDSEGNAEFPAPPRGYVVYAPVF